MHVHEFIRCPKWQLRCMPPCAETYEDACLLTCKSAREIRHAVKTQDGRIYDALSLQHWLRIQKNGSYVVPGVDIVHVESYSWIRYMRFVCLHVPTLLRRIWIAVYVLFHAGRVVYSMATLKRVSDLNRDAPRQCVVTALSPKKIAIPGPHSAFRPFRRSHLALERL